MSTDTTDPTQMPAVGATGDPHIVRVDAHRFDFIGTPNATYNLLTHGDISIHAALSGSGKFFHREMIHPGPGGWVEFDERDLKRVVTANGYLIDIHRFGSTDNGAEPYLDIQILQRPSDLTGATGILIDGSPLANPLDYQVASPPA